MALVAVDHDLEVGHLNVHGAVMTHDLESTIQVDGALALLIEGRVCDVDWELEVNDLAVCLYHLCSLSDGDGACSER